ncbi:hypothetical protein HDF19_21100 [Mucilaginibacter sp. E4BP6]|uniref:hypothetical protein n=1 Tax=Mucilaginibacter sp. E4BP6 TaxID=2723089 RepID=UPI0015CE201A|nr:hypothetical protein [Mucilaginibacter sp. E4BP6]NYE67835.1 hypothetical protein [Mucilaginibacter sp. E4BP6]
MESFTVMLEIYNLSMVLLVTPVANSPFCFRIRTVTHGPKAMTITRLPDLSWNAVDIQMKYFTVDTIQRLGALIEFKKPKLFLPEIP